MSVVLSSPPLINENIQKKIRCFYTLWETGVGNKSWTWVLACSLLDEPLISHTVPVFRCTLRSLATKTIYQAAVNIPNLTKTKIISLCSYQHLSQRWLTSYTCAMRATQRPPTGSLWGITGNTMVRWLQDTEGLFGAELLSLVTNTPSYLIT